MPNICGAGHDHRTELARDACDLSEWNRKLAAMGLPMVRELPRDRTEPIVPPLPQEDLGL